MPLLVHTVWRRDWNLKIPAYVAGSGALPLAMSFMGYFNGAQAYAYKYNTGTDAVTSGISLLKATYDGGAVSCINNAIVLDGVQPAPVTSTEKYTYGTDAVTAATAVTNARGYTANVSTPSFGLFMGGSTQASGSAVSGQVTVVDKYTFGGDTDVATTALGTAVTAAAGLNSGSAAIIGGGNTGTYTQDVTTLTKYDLASGTQSASAASLLRARRGLSSYGSGSVGYFVGGAVSNTGPVNNVDKYTFATDAVAAATALATALDYASGGGCATFGLLLGGYTGTTNVNSVDKRAFSSDTSVAGSNLPTQICDNTGTGPQINGLQAAGGGGGGALPLILVAGGYTGTATLGTISKYATDTDAVTAGTALGIATYGGSGISSTTAAIFQDGAMPTAVQTTEKYTYATDVLGAGANTSSARGYSAGVAGSTFGLFMAGATACSVGVVTGLSAVVDQYTFAADTVAPTTALPSVRGGAAAVNTGTNALIGAGTDSSSPLSSTTKYNLSTFASTAGATLANARRNLAATGSTTVGYFDGGFGLSNAVITVSDQYTYASDAVTTATALLTAVAFCPEAASRAAGYTFGGYVAAGPSRVNNTQKRTFAGDTVAAATAVSPSGYTDSSATGPQTNGLQ